MTGNGDTEDEKTHQEILEDLNYRYRGVFEPEEIAAAVDDARHRLQANATITTFLPVLVARFAREQLVAAAQAQGRIAKPVPEVLFVCVRNAGRSQMAAAIAEHLAAGRIHVRSAGSRPDGEIQPGVVDVLAERGINLTEAYPKPLTDDAVRAADVIVTMGCGDTCPVYPGRQYQDWPVADPDGAGPEELRDIRDDIQTRVTTLLRSLGV